MPQSMITNVTTGGSAIIHRGPASNPPCLAPPSSAPAGRAWPAPAAAGCVLGGWVLGEVTARCLPVETGCGH